ncbi:MAG: hypothetical protein IIY06_01510 [Proteobacteria bacterium]|nr:hypothetical protein [Pseudomonadota bacterium]
MEKLNVSYYLSERLVSKIDERSGQRSGNRSRQVADDLGRFYDLLDAGLHAALEALTSDEIRSLISALKSQQIPSPVGVKSALMDIVKHPSITPKIAALDDIACFALWDWARTNR